LFEVSLLEQTPCFATDKHIIAMNPQWNHVLRRPNLQDLRRLKFTKTTCSGKNYNWANVQIYTNSYVGRTFRRHSARNVNLRWAFFSSRGLVAITAVIAAVARALLIRVRWFLTFSRGLKRCGAFSPFSSSIS
jgi:hypothetical protein